jgi:hypothetical protein
MATVSAAVLTLVLAPAAILDAAPAIAAPQPSQAEAELDICAFDNMVVPSGSLTQGMLEMRLHALIDPRKSM